MSGTQRPSMTPRWGAAVDDYHTQPPFDQESETIFGTPAVADA